MVKHQRRDARLLSELPKRLWGAHLLSESAQHMENSFRKKGISSGCKIAVGGCCVWFLAHIIPPQCLWALPHGPSGRSTFPSSFACLPSALRLVAAPQVKHTSWVPRDKRSATSPLQHHPILKHREKY
eukprot:6483836-Amphidinium_carterae.2